jgi:hypothetical protein
MTLPDNSVIIYASVYFMVAYTTDSQADGASLPAPKVFGSRQGVTLSFRLSGRQERTEESVGL